MKKFIIFTVYLRTTRKKGFRKTLLSLERTVHVIAGRVLNPKLRMEEEEEDCLTNIVRAIKIRILK